MMDSFSRVDALSHERCFFRPPQANGMIRLASPGKACGREEFQACYQEVAVKPPSVPSTTYLPRRLVNPSSGLGAAHGPSPLSTYRPVSLLAFRFLAPHA
jgi:hypothetical protein